MEEKNKFNKVAYNNKFNKNNYDRVGVLMPKGKKEVVKNYAKKKGESVNAFINRAIDETMANDK